MSIDRKLWESRPQGYSILRQIIINKQNTMDSVVDTAAEWIKPLY